MTPLAQNIVKQIFLPPSVRCFHDYFGQFDIKTKMSDVHCFEFSESRDLVMSLGDTLLSTLSEKTGARVALDANLAFLPAPKTWLEMREPSGNRIGYLLEEVVCDRGRFAALDICGSRGAKSWHQGIGLLPLVDDAGVCGSIRIPPHKDYEKGNPLLPWAAAVSFYMCAYAMLAMINTPRLIGRQQHMPHRGLERDIVRKAKLTPKTFPLHAWTEIKLKVTSPEDWSGAESTEAHLTGKKALHFCRAHLRVLSGKVVWVRSHWRGDANLGIRQARYKVTDDRPPPDDSHPPSIGG